MASPSFKLTAQASTAAASSRCPQQCTRKNCGCKHYVLGLLVVRHYSKMVLWPLDSHGVNALGPNVFADSLYECDRFVGKHGIDGGKTINALGNPAKDSANSGEAPSSSVQDPQPFGSAPTGE